jgi:hypothetical protein
MKSTALKRFLLPAVGKRGRRDVRPVLPSSWPAMRRRYCRTSMVPRGTRPPDRSSVNVCPVSNWTVASALEADANRQTVRVAAPQAPRSPMINTAMRTPLPPLRSLVWGWLETGLFVVAGFQSVPRPFYLVWAISLLLHRRTQARKGFSQKPHRGAARRKAHRQHPVQIADGFLGKGRTRHLRRVAGKGNEPRLVSGEW